MALELAPGDLTKMLQMQTEACALLRQQIRDAGEMLIAKKSVHNHNVFINNMNQVAASLRLPLEVVFQCLMHMGEGGHGSVAHFDHQARQGNVPMHQAKVLKRDAALEHEPRVAAAVPPEQLREMIAFSGTLRSLLRMKCEDGNDLSMAQRAVGLADDYFTRIAKFGSDDADVMWQLFMANSEHDLLRIIQTAGGGSGAAPGLDGDAAAMDGSHGNGRGGFGGSMTSGGSSTGGVDSLLSSMSIQPMPSDLVGGVESICKKSLLSSTIPVPERQNALANIESWFREASWTQELVRAICSGSFRRAVTMHLAEKRSALCRATCDIVSTLMQNTPAQLAAVMEVRDSVVAWMDVLLKQVHVTVSTIANATDLCVRDILAATGGLLPVLSACGQVASSASQPELQRKCLGYLALGLVSHMFASTGDPTQKCALLANCSAKLLKSGNEGVRRAARVAGIMARHVSPSVPIAGWDERVERAAAADAGVVIEAAMAGLATFETTALRYSDACTVSKQKPLDGSPLTPIQKPAPLSPDDVQVMHHHHNQQAIPRNGSSQQVISPMLSVTSQSSTSSAGVGGTSLSLRASTLRSATASSSAASSTAPALTSQKPNIDRRSNLSGSVSAKAPVAAARAGTAGSAGAGAGAGAASLMMQGSYGGGGPSGMPMSLSGTTRPRDSPGTTFSNMRPAPSNSAAAAGATRGLSDSLRRKIGSRGAALPTEASASSLTSSTSSTASASAQPQYQQHAQTSQFRRSN